MPNESYPDHQRHTSQSPPRARSTLSKARGRQVQSGRGRTGRDRSATNRSRGGNR